MRIAPSLGLLLAAVATAAPAFATTDAYVLIETADGRDTDVLNTNWGFGQCKGLAAEGHRLRHPGAGRRQACDALDDFGKALTGLGGGSLLEM